MAAKTRARDPHDGIPKDANGDPIFLILPDGVRRSYERTMAACKAGWRETGDPAFVGEAHTVTRLHRQPSPEWLDEAVWTLAVRRRTKGYAKRARDAHVRFLRYAAVRDAKADGVRLMKRLAERAAEEDDTEGADKWRRAARRAAERGQVSWDEAKALAIEVLTDSPAACSEPDTVWKTYKRVKQDLKRGRGGLYSMPKMRREKPAKPAS